MHVLLVYISSSVFFFFFAHNVLHMNICILQLNNEEGDDLRTQGADTLYAESETRPDQLTERDQPTDILALTCYAIFVFLRHHAFI